MDEEAFLRAFGFPALTWAPAYVDGPADMAVKPPNENIAPACSERIQQGKTPGKVRSTWPAFE